MNIDWVIPCRYVEVHDNLGTIIGAGIDTFWLPNLPAQLRVLLAIRLLAMTEELDPAIQHPIRNVIRDPNGELVTEQSGTFAIGAQSARPEWLAGIIVPTAVVFQVNDEGTYTIEFGIDDASESLPIHVVHGLPPGMPGSAA
jgi:hypothetical protein